jgi:sulfide dehydrogenase cytochrome subunit
VTPAATAHRHKENTMKRTLVTGLAFGLLTALPATAQVAGAPHPGRLLASNCFQCHGTNGRGSGTFESLAGKSASELYKELQEMKRESKPDDIMNVHARGYSDAQLQLIADYFSKQPK